MNIISVSHAKYDIVISSFQPVILLGGGFKSKLWLQETIRVPGFDYAYISLLVHPTNPKQVISLVIGGLTLVIPLITRDITYLVRWATYNQGKHIFFHGADNSGGVCVTQVPRWCDSLCLHNPSCGWDRK